MPPIETSNVRIGQDVDHAPLQDEKKTPQLPQASSNPNTAGPKMAALMAMRESKAGAVARPPSTFVPGKESGRPPQVEHPTTEPVPQQEGRPTGLRRGLDSNAMQMFQQTMQMSMQSQQMQLNGLQQASSSMEQFNNSLADGMTKAAR